MEQEYQMFIQTLREFLKDRDPKFEQLHLLFAMMTLHFLIRILAKLNGFRTCKNG